MKSRLDLLEAVAAAAREAARDPYCFRAITRAPKNCRTLGCKTEDLCGHCKINEALKELDKNYNGTREWTTGEVAAAVRRHRITVRYWCEDGGPFGIGKIRHRIDALGRRQIPDDEARRIIACVARAGR